MNAAYILENPAVQKPAGKVADESDVVEMVVALAEVYSWPPLLHSQIMSSFLSTILISIAVHPKLLARNEPALELHDHEYSPNSRKNDEEGPCKFADSCPYIRPLGKSE